MMSGFMETTRIESLCHDYKELEREVNDIQSYLNTADSFRVESRFGQSDHYLGATNIPKEYNRKITRLFEDIVSDNLGKMKEIRSKISNLALGKDEVVE